MSSTYSELRFPPHSSLCFVFSVPTLFPFATVPRSSIWSHIFLNTRAACTHILNTENGHTRTKSTHRARTVPIHLTKPLSSWKRLIWAPAAPNHPIRDRAISSPLGLSEPFVQVPLFPRRWQDGVVFRAPCHSFWARSEGLSLAWLCSSSLQFSVAHWTAVKSAQRRCPSKIAYLQFCHFFFFFAAKLKATIASRNITLASVTPLSADGWIDGLVWAEKSYPPNTRLFWET